MSILPVIDVSSLRSDASSSRTAAEIAVACRDTGFFYVVGHGVDATLVARLDALSREFFSLPHDEKMQIAMARGGLAWRGFFPVGDELTSGVPDQKEGLYFGRELGPEHAHVRAGTPLHGANLFPSRPAELAATVLRYMDELTTLGHTLMRGIGLSLGLDADYFATHYTTDPLILFRIFHYPPLAAAEQVWSVGEHTDYGLLTILRQDDCGGLQVKSKQGWLEAPPIPDSFVCNIGDMLDRMTGGVYRSTPHRVRNTSGRGRLSFPFFFDPNFDARIHRIGRIELGSSVSDDRDQRWDGESVHDFEGTYGDYLRRKVARVFPQLSRG